MNTSRSRGRSGLSCATARITDSASSQSHSPPFHSTSSSSSASPNRSRGPGPGVGGVSETPNGHDREQAAERRVGVVDGGRDQALGEQRARPQVALALRGAQERVAVVERVDHPVERHRRHRPPHPGPPAGEELQRLERLRVVEVVDQPRARAPQRPRRERPRRLRDHHARGGRPLAEVPGRVGVRVDGLAPDRARELRGADGHARHLRAERLRGEDERHARYAFLCRHAPSGPVGAASGAGPRVAAPARRYARHSRRPARRPRRGARVRSVAATNAT